VVHVSSSYLDAHSSAIVRCHKPGRSWDEGGGATLFFRRLFDVCLTLSRLTSLYVVFFLLFDVLLHNIN
jgi:hypothetical protein